MRTCWLVLKFLFGSRWQTLHDRQLTIVARLMRVLFVVYLIGFMIYGALLFAFGINKANRGV
jgi:hypothetical protein